MRKITIKARNAMAEFRPFREGNTQVVIEPLGDATTAKLYLHGNLIAQTFSHDPKIMFSLAGWATPTTRERLKAVWLNLYQQAGVQYSHHDTPILPDAVYVMDTVGFIERVESFV